MTTAKELRELANKAAEGIAERQLPGVIENLERHLGMSAKLGGYHVVWSPPIGTHEHTVAQLYHWMDTRGFHWRELPDLSLRIWW